LLAPLDTLEPYRISDIVMRLATVAAVLVVSASAIAEPVSSSDMLVVVLQKQNGTRETHSQSIEADDCGAMLKLFKESNEKGQSPYA
jgi:hypothetical protein